MSMLKLLPIGKGRKTTGQHKNTIKENDPDEVISLDGDEDGASDSIEDDIEEVVSDVQENKSNSEHSLECPEVISLVDDDDDDGDSYSSDENEEIPIGTAKLTFLDAANKKVHKFIQITNAENETDHVNVEDVSSDSDVEVIDKPVKNAYISIDPDDYKKVVNNDETHNIEDHKNAKRKKIVIPENKKKIKKSVTYDPSGKNNFEVTLEDFRSSLSNKKKSEHSEPSESLKGPNIPKALCCHSCSFISFKQEDLSVHIASKHPAKAESLRTYTAAEIQELEREMRDQADDCSSCGQALWYLPTLRAHAMIHPSGKGDCEACHHGTSVIKLLMDHLESHVGSEEEEDSDL